jgi:hypothetical protein
VFLVRAFLYVAVCAYLVLVLPGTGDAFAGAAWTMLASARGGDAGARLFLAGAAVFVPVALLCRGALRFWYTLAHEVSHTVSAMLLGGAPGELAVGSSGEGRVTFARAPRVLWLVLLAPYVVSPTYLVPLAVPWLEANARAAGAAAAGAATAFALVSNALQVRAYQSDIRRAGLLRSLLFITWGNLLACALAMTLVAAGGRAALGVLRTSVWP